MYSCCRALPSSCNNGTAAAADAIKTFIRLPSVALYSWQLREERRRGRGTGPSEYQVDGHERDFEDLAVRMLVHNARSELREARLLSPEICTIEAHSLSELIRQ